VKAAVARVVTGVAAAGLLSWALADVAPGLYRPGTPTDQDTIQSGEMLLHGIRYGMGSDNFPLPLASISAALIIGHAPAGSDVFWRNVSAATAFLLILALGVELGSLRRGLLAAALLLCVARFHDTARVVPAWHGQWGHLQTYYGLLVLAAAAFSVRLAREPSRGRAWLAALALGASLLYRSTLVLLPPLLALYVWRRAKPSSSGAWRTPALVAVVPYLFLLPWIAMNWSVHRSFIPLEHGETAPIIVGGVLGSIEKDWPRVPAEFGLADAGTAEVLAWAVPRVLAHPLDYLLGFARRLRYVVLLNPLLFLLAALSWLRHRRQPEIQTLGLLCSYFLLIHCFMSFLHEYFDPLWPLLAVLGAALPGVSLQDAPSAPVRRAAAAVETGFLGVNLLLCLFVYATLASYARAAAGGTAAADVRLGAALARHPRDGELYYARGMRRLQAGDAAAAFADARLAAELLPGNERVLRGEVWLGLYQGAAAPFARWNSAARGYDAEALLLRVNGFLSAGRTADARAALAEYSRLPAGDSEHGDLDLRGVRRPFIAKMCDRAVELPELASVCLDNAANSIRGEDPGAARVVVDAVRRARIDSVERRRADALDRQLRVKADAVPGRLLLDRAVIAVQRNDRAAALQALAAAQSNAAPDVRHRAALLYMELGDFSSALAVLSELISGDPNNAVYIADKVEAAARLRAARR